MNHKLPLIVICGPTASGKTGLAIKIAQQFGGEVISADSRAIYKGLDIGTAKPTNEEQLGVPHWGIDISLPGEPYSAAQFKQYANEKIHEIRSRGNIPILAGGTGLYINSVVYNYVFPPMPSLAERRKYEALTIDELHEYCVKNNISIPENAHNKRYVINTILRSGHLPTRDIRPTKDTIIVGITTDKETLMKRIGDRAEIIFSPDTYKEADCVAKKYGWDSEAMTANVYRLLRKVMNSEMSESEARSKFVTLDWRLAKRQMTWFKRDSNILWLNLEEAGTYLVRTLDNLNKS
jgi:tRNA dimethylallyltransferase